MTTAESFYAPRRLALVAATLCLSWCSVAAYSASAALPDIAIDLPGAHHPIVSLLSPQGWAFFTRDPREPQGFVLERRDAQWHPLRGFRVASPENGFGAARTARKLGIEYGMLFNSVAEDAWFDCRGDLGECLDAHDDAAVLDNQSPVPAICGDIALVSQPAVPWAWSRTNKSIAMPSRIVKLRVSC